LARKNLLKIKQAAELLQISVYTAYKWAELGRLPAVKIGYSLRPDTGRPRQMFSMRGQRLAGRLI
jgi:excisionase family DNA binding protein